jgi:hypothetical protein
MSGASGAERQIPRHENSRQKIIYVGWKFHAKRQFACTLPFAAPISTMNIRRIPHASFAHTHRFYDTQFAMVEFPIATSRRGADNYIAAQRQAKSGLQATGRK